MTEFDYNEYKVVGYVDLFPNNSNAKIDVVGCVDWRNNFISLKESEAQKLFPPYGRVFAHNFADKFYEYKGTLVCISVIPNEKVGEGYYAFIWNKSGGVYEFGARVKKLKGSFTANGQYNYSLLKENNLLEVDHDTYVSSGGAIYLIKADSQDRLISYWKEGSLDTINVNGRLYITDTVKGGEDGKIDITTDEQLQEWFMKNVLKKNWNQIFEEKTFRNVEPLIRDAFASSKGLDGLVVSSRIKRLIHITRVLTISFEELNELKSLPWLKDTIEQSVSAYKNAYLEEVEKEKAKELQEIRDRYDMEILVEKEQAEAEKQKLAKQIESLDETYQSKLAEQEKLLLDKKVEAELIDESVEGKRRSVAALEESINRLEKRKQDIIEDFSVIKEVLGTGIDTSVHGVMVNSVVEEINYSNDAIPVYQVFIKSLENILKANKVTYSVATDLGNQVAFFKILLVPDVAIAKMIVMASMKCRYSIEYVCATWKSFDDLWQNGLGQIVDECYKKEDVMHFLILQNINLTYLPNYMMPLIDIQRDIISMFPGVNIKFPDNLRIICTVAKDELIPLAENCIKHIGCIDRIIEKEFNGRIVAPENTNIGYLTPKILKEEGEISKYIPNYYRSYLEDE
jgi:hypothetical protein